VNDEGGLERAFDNLATTNIRLKKGAKITLSKDITKVKHNAIGIVGADSAKHAVIQGTRMCDFEPCGKDKGHSIRLDDVNPDLDFIKNISFERGLAENVGIGSGGGAFYIAGSLLNGIENSEFTHNSTDQNGGALFIGNEFNGGISKSHFKNNNSTVAGGAIYIDSGGYFNGGISNSEFIGNIANGAGGAIAVYGDFNGGIRGSEFTGNSSVPSGGALYIEGILTGGIDKTIFMGNASGADLGGTIFTTSLKGDIKTSRFMGNNAFKSGGALYVDDKLTGDITSSIFQGNYSQKGQGGAIYVNDLEGDIDSSQFSDNQAFEEGGGIYIQDTFFGGILNSQFNENKTESNGGAVFIGDTLKGDIHDHSKFKDNLATSSGGALYAATFFGGISDSLFHANKAGVEGGALYVGDTLEGDISSSHFKENNAGKNGGALYTVHMAGDTTSSSFENNQANEKGGALFIEGTLKGWVKDSIFIDNSADKDGGAIYVSGLLSGDITHSEFTENATSREKYITHNGGAIYANILAETISYSRFIDNSAMKDGGAIYAHLALTSNVKQSEFLDNIAEDGGAIYVGDTLEGSVSDSVFRSNSADYLGGAIFAYQLEGDMKNSIFTDNTSTGWGGAIYLGKSDRGEIESSIFVVNKSERNEAHLEGGGLGGAIFSYGRDGNNDLTLTNTAFLKNAALTDKDDVYGGHGGAIFHNAAEEEGHHSTLTIATTEGNSSLFYGNYSRSGEEDADGEDDRTVSLAIQADEASDIFMLDPIESQGDEAEDVNENGDDILYGNLDVNVNKRGAGNWYLGGASEMHSATRWSIDEGALILTDVDGQEASITLEHDDKAQFHLGVEGILAGSGTIAAHEISLAGVLAPSSVAKFGSDIDNIVDEETMDVWVEKTSDYGLIKLETLDGEAVKLDEITYVVDVGDDDNDLVTAVGDITIKGGLVDARSHITSKDENNRYKEARYVIMESETGSISGKFAEVKSDFAFWKAQLDYLDNQIVLGFVRDDSGARASCQSRNQCRLGEVIIGLEDGHQVKDALIDMTEENLSRAYDNLSGEIYASSRAALLDDSPMLQKMRYHMGHHRIAQLSAQTDALPVWISTFSHDGHLFSNYEAARLRRTSHGTVLGFDGGNDDGIFLNVALGYEKYRLTNGLARNSRTDIDSYNGGVLLGRDWGDFHISGGAVYSMFDIHTARDIWVASTMSSLEGTAKAHYSGHKLQFFGEISTNLDLGTSLTVSPYLQLSQSILHTSSAHENGTEAALDIAARHDSMFSTTLGLRGFTQLPHADSTRLYGVFGWRHGFRQGHSQSDNSLRNARQAFTVEGVDFERDTGFAEIGISASLGNVGLLDIGYQGHFGQDATNHGATMHLKFSL